MKKKNLRKDSRRRDGSRSDASTTAETIPNSIEKELKSTQQMCGDLFGNPSKELKTQEVVVEQNTSLELRELPYYRNSFRVLQLRFRSTERVPTKNIVFGAVDWADSIIPPISILHPSIQIGTVKTMFFSRSTEKQEGLLAYAGPSWGRLR